MKKWFLLALMLVLIMIPGAAMADYTEDLMPAMTSNTTPSGVASASSEYPGATGAYPLPAWNAFNNTTVDAYDGWGSNNTLTGWLAYEFPSPKIITKYTLTCENYTKGPARAPNSWTFEGWDGNEWVVLDTQINITRWIIGVKKEFTFNSLNAYSKYRINVSAINGDPQLVMIGEMEMMESTNPSAPNNLTATAGNAQVVLNWDAVTDATGYNVKRATTSAGPYETVASNVSGATYTDTSATNGTTYYYVVTATSSGGESSNSNEASATPQESLPNVPANLSATAGNAQVSLSWGAVTDATGYNVKRATTSGGPYETVASDVSGTTYTDTSVTNGTTYYYVVTAIVDGAESGDSNEASATPQAPAGGTRAVLWVTMDNGADLDYDLSMEEVNAFIDWYDSKAGGVGKPYYTFSKTPISPYTSRTDYLIFNKIVDFKVNKY